MTIEQLNSTTEQRELVLDIMNGAMIATQESVAHVFVNYSAHTQVVDIHANPTNTDYQDTQRPLGRIFNHTIWLDDYNCIDQLKQAMNDINALYDNWETSQEIVLAAQ